MIKNIAQNRIHNNKTKSDNYKFL